MNKEQLAARTKALAVGVFKACECLPNNMATRVIAGQLLRCSSSVASNYRAALRAKSRADFSYKIKVVLEEVDESEFWISLLQDAGIKNSCENEFERLRKESNELAAIFYATLRTLAQRENENAEGGKGRKR